MHGIEQAWTAKALEFCERFENPRKPEMVQRALDAVQHALKERAKRQGATVEEIAEEMQRKQAALDSAMEELHALNSLNKVCLHTAMSRYAVR